MHLCASVRLRGVRKVVEAVCGIMSHWNPHVRLLNGPRLAAPCCPPACPPACRLLSRCPSMQDFKMVSSRVGAQGGIALAQGLAAGGRARGWAGGGGSSEVQARAAGALASRLLLFKKFFQEHVQCATALMLWLYLTAPHCHALFCSHGPRAPRPPRQPHHRGGGAAPRRPAAERRRRRRRRAARAQGAGAE